MSAYPTAAFTGGHNRIVKDKLVLTEVETVAQAA